MAVSGRIRGLMFENNQVSITALMPSSVKLATANVAQGRRVNRSTVGQLDAGILDLYVCISTAKQKRRPPSLANYNPVGFDIRGRGIKGGAR